MPEMTPEPTITFGQWLKETVEAIEGAGWDVRDFGGFPIVMCEGKDEKKIRKLLDMNLPRGGIKNLLPGKVLITPFTISEMAKMFPSGRME